MDHAFASKYLHVLRDASMAACAKAMVWCMQERFLPYLPQDNAGLADAQAELVCEIINDEIAELLSHPALELWNAIANDNSLIACLDTYLRYSR